MTERPIRVGIADDDPSIRFTLARALSRAPILQIVGAVENGAAAVELAVSGEIDVLVLDVEMPTMDGREALRHIRAVAPSVKVVMHSSRPANKNATDFQRAGAVAYVEKPAEIARLVDVIEQAAGVERKDC